MNFQKKIYTKIIQSRKTEQFTKYWIDFTSKKFFYKKTSKP